MPAKYKCMSCGLVFKPKPDQPYLPPTVVLAEHRKLCPKKPSVLNKQARLRVINSDRKEQPK